ncbi:DUF3311 domain-containing protein [Rossellomorea sp. BNER]|uniref:DUF3311 domain-containing protein n=1 Tax=Rossellomorea sp. BNER TaxID=2962031 RepID=UPI003AF2EE9E|nr:DUF3311 domain-containing protein [Rossellomorea sp. BNER]
MQKIYFLVLIPILFILGAPIFANKVTPYILGLPFFMFFVCLSVLVTSLTLLTINKFDVKAKEDIE